MTYRTVRTANARASTSEASSGRSRSPGRGDVTTRPKDVFGSLPYKGPAKSIADMAARIAAEAKQRHARNRT